mmetsp:Transcript_22172/g.30946  ORF Transcript_22172/g.30946 Transcript_22172/m.30946 type:complete len:225 (-) Transcript_22172:91-765(-)|eukprot:CAMPEP_0184489264 /NCGR_PEP_ID=MMETSP0113_2-20130426/14966_1 /TAXON_ID=91329 /ORGANISM="Norrisiella sphaerica, Strain BC52" /LENGTH=224 /DNA_ID=CAMNT_0026872587 /DNA_START=127 /DNA_END=801 /DNA_ORIENTATION=-
METSTSEPSLLRILQVALKTSKAYDKLARTLQYGSSFLLVTYYKNKCATHNALSKVKSTTGSCRRILRWGQFVGVLLDMNYSPKNWHGVCQTISDGSLALFYVVENLIYAAQCGVVQLSDSQLKRLIWWSDFFWLFEVLPLVPKYADLLLKGKEKGNDLKREALYRTFFISAFDSLVAGHDLHLKHRVSTPTRHLLGTITSIIGVRSVYLAAVQTLKEKRHKVQ